MTTTKGITASLHEIYDSLLRLIGDNDIASSSAVLNGTSPAINRNGPIEDIPTNITLLSESAICIWLVPIRLNNHF